MPIPLSPLTEQQQIVAEVEQRLSVIAAAEIEISRGLRRADRLRQSILKHAFDGKLVPQDLKDEPASVLLERIKTVSKTSDQTASARRSPRSHSRKKTSIDTKGIE